MASDTGHAAGRALRPSPAALDVARWSAQAPTPSTWRSGQRHRHAAGRRCGRRQLHGLDVVQWVSSSVTLSTWWRSGQLKRHAVDLVAVANDTGTLPARRCGLRAASFASCTALDVVRWSAQAPRCRPGAVANDTGTLQAGRCEPSPVARPGRGAAVRSSATPSTWRGGRRHRRAAGRRCGRRQLHGLDVVQWVSSSVTLSTWWRSGQLKRHAVDLVAVANDTGALPAGARQCGKGRRAEKLNIRPVWGGCAGATFARLNRFYVASE